MYALSGSKLGRLTVRQSCFLESHFPFLYFLSLTLRSLSLSLSALSITFSAQSSSLLNTKTCSICHHSPLLSFTSGWLSQWISSKSIHLRFLCNIKKSGFSRTAHHHNQSDTCFDLNWEGSQRLSVCLWASKMALTRKTASTPKLPRLWNRARQPTPWWRRLHSSLSFFGTRAVLLGAKFERVAQKCSYNTKKSNRCATFSAPQHFAVRDIFCKIPRKKKTKLRVFFTDNIKSHTA